MVVRSMKEMSDEENVEGEEDQDWENAADALLSAWKKPELLADAPVEEKEGSSWDFRSAPKRACAPPLDFRALGGLPAALEALGISTPSTSSRRVNAAPRPVPEKTDSCVPRGTPEAVAGEHADAPGSRAATKEVSAGQSSDEKPSAGASRAVSKESSGAGQLHQDKPPPAPRPPPTKAEDPTPPAVDFQSLGAARQTATFEALGLPKLTSAKQGLRRQGSKEDPWPSASAHVPYPAQPPQPPAPPDVRPVLPEQHLRPERHQFPSKAMPASAEPSMEANAKVVYRGTAGQGEQQVSGHSKVGTQSECSAGPEQIPQKARQKPGASSPARPVPAEVMQMQAAMKKHLEAARGEDAEQMREALRAQRAEREREENEQRRVEEAKAKRAKLAEQWKRELQEAYHREEEKLRRELAESRKRERARREAEQQHFREQQQRFHEDQWENARAPQRSQWNHRQQRSASTQHSSPSHGSSPPRRQQSVPPPCPAAPRPQKPGVDAEWEAVRHDIFQSMRRIGSESNLDQRRQLMRDLVRNWHPDKHPADDPRRQQIATAAFQLIQANRQQVLDGGAPK